LRRRLIREARRAQGRAPRLNVLLCLAEFEREVTAERIRDKIKAEKEGLWMGGLVLLG
jgi:DNA invertase Pin-like site-specific DNA recombinase